MRIRELLEDDSKTAVVTFGRMNPPTTGHKKLIEKITSLPGDPFVFLSHTQNSKDNPLDFNTKLVFAEQFFPGVTIGDSSVRTIVEMMQKLENLGYKNVVCVAGSDRVDQFNSVLSAYNGKPDKKGNILYNFESINVVSAGLRDPDAQGTKGMSASKMREAAFDSDLTSFTKGVPVPELAEKLYDAVRQGMIISE